MDQPVEPLAALGRSVAAAQDRQLSGLETHTRERLLEELGTGRRSRRARAAAFALAAAACLAIVAWALWPRSLSFSIAADGTAGQLDEWIEAPTETTVPLTFSDGTRLVLGPRASARVTAMDRAGAKLVVERGHVDAAVVPRAGASWRLLFGPFEVRVTGTKFAADWSPETQQLSVELREGSVVVTGPGLGAGHALRAGSRLEASAVERRFTVASTDAPSPATARTAAPEPAEPSSRPAAGPTADAGGAEPDAGRTPAAPLGHGWRSLYAANRYTEALQAAQREGYDRLCADAGPADLLMLAEMARYGGAPALAEQTFSLLRARYGASPLASVAAFHLGTMAFDNRGAYAEAATWFARYLSEQPRGAMAHEAMVRLIEARERSGDRPGARAAAERYLERYPDGPHAERARRLLDAPAPHPP